MKKMLAGLLVLFSLTAYQSKAYENSYSVMPENNLFVPESEENLFEENKNPAVSQVAGLTRAQFDAVLDRVYKLYAPIMAAKGAQFYIHRSWSNPTVNAQAWRQGNVWNIEMFGGLARYRNMSMDGFMLVACHETGHLLGGAPLYPGQDMAVEGQSDYFATVKCGKRFTALDDSKAITDAINIDPVAKQECNKYNVGDYYRCVRLATAGKVLANLLADGEGVAHPKLETPDRTVARQTVYIHPHAQCRLDTMFRGGFCKVDPATPASQSNPSVNYCVGTDPGTRPACWYKAAK